MIYVKYLSHIIYLVPLNTIISPTEESLHRDSFKHHKGIHRPNVKQYKQKGSHDQIYHQLRSDWGYNDENEKTKISSQRYNPKPPIYRQITKTWYKQALFAGWVMKKIKDVQNQLKKHIVPIKSNQNQKLSYLYI